jgi:hypothetical protein
MRVCLFKKEFRVAIIIEKRLVEICLYNYLKSVNIFSNDFFNTGRSFLAISQTNLKFTPKYS